MISLQTKFNIHCYNGSLVIATKPEVNYGFCSVVYSKQITLTNSTYLSKVY
jgi:hypothetical protein